MAELNVLIAQGTGSSSRKIGRETQDLRNPFTFSVSDKLDGVEPAS